MTDLEPPGSASEVLPTTRAIAQLPALFRSTPAAAMRSLEFFMTQIRNLNARTVHARSVSELAARCKAHRLYDLADIEPVHVATYIEQLRQRFSAPCVKMHLAACGYSPNGWW